MAKRPKTSVTVRLREGVITDLRAWVDAAHLSMSEGIELLVSKGMKRERLRKTIHKHTDNDQPLT